MEDLTRLIISHERIENIKNNNLELSKEEAHYLNKVMRIKNGKKIFIANGEGSLWKAIKVKNDCLEIIKSKKPYLFQEQEIHLLGIAVVIPKSGFEDILKMCTEIGIDYIQPLFSERQVNKNLNFSRKLLRWNLIINEAVEQSERLWKPSILNGMDIIEWLKSRNNQERVSISITREETIYDLNQWLRKQQEFENKKGGIFWNVIGPEGGWSAKEIDFFKKNNITFVKLSDTILRTSTASINASSILNQWLRKQQEFLNKKGGIFWNVIGPEGGWSSKEIDFFNKNNINFVKLSETILRTSTASINASSILNQWRIDLKLRN